MELEYVKILSAIGLFTITFLATMLPLFVFKNSRDNFAREDFRVISFLNCFGGGVFFATCLLHLFPDVQMLMDRIFKGFDIVPNYPVAEFLLGFGFLVILIVEQIVLNCQEHDDFEQVPILRQEPSLNELAADIRRLCNADGETVAAPRVAPPNYGTIHPENTVDPQVAFEDRVLSPSLLRSLLLVLALSLHSVFEGLAIGLQTSAQSDLRILLAVILHKSIIAFTLGLNLTRSQMGSASVVKSNVFFSLTSPVGILLGMLVVDFVEGLPMVVASGILQGLAAGTFLYITLFEVLPKELACGKDRMVKMAFVVFGYSVVSLLLTFLPE